MRLPRLFTPAQPDLRKISWADLVVVIGLLSVFFLLVKLSSVAPQAIRSAHISTSVTALPIYALFSVGRMFIAYILSIVFAIVYGSSAASSARKEKVLLPILDILQSIPILGYLPLVVMALTAILPLGFAKELSAILLIFTGQAWNMAFSWYQSLTTTPNELKEASSIFRLSRWSRFTNLQFPFAAIGFIWNSVMSWAGGWFALMASETFSLRDRHFQLPGIGSYIQKAADDTSDPAHKTLIYGLITLLLVIVALDQLMWRPLLAWADKFRLDMVSNEIPPTSWVYDSFKSSKLMRQFRRKVWRPAGDAIDLKMRELFPPQLEFTSEAKEIPTSKFLVWILISVAVYISFESFKLLSHVTLIEWGKIVLGVLATTLRVLFALMISLGWTIPVGYFIGTNQKAARIFQPIIQQAASVPATAIYPIFLIFLLPIRGGLEIAAMLLMLAGTQWYVMFNIIAGARAIPQDLKYTAELMGLKGIQKWKTFILPALFPYIATGAITASGGAWNASIFAEYTHSGDTKYSTAYGIGAIVARSQDNNNFPLLLASTLAMVFTVVIINRLVWKKVYATAEERFRLE